MKFLEENIFKFQMIVLAGLYLLELTWENLRLAQNLEYTQKNRVFITLGPSTWNFL